jgi:PleD family two-component response regulator
VRDRVRELTAPQTVSVGVSTFTERLAPDVAFDRVNALEEQANESGRNRVVAD